MRGRAWLKATHELGSLSVSLGQLGTKEPLRAARAEEALPEISGSTLKEVAGGCGHKFGSGSLRLFVLLLSALSVFGISIVVFSLLIFFGLLLLQLGEGLLGELAIGSDSGDLLGVGGVLRARLALRGLGSVYLVLEDAHAFGLAIRNEVDSHLLVSHHNPVDIVEATALELEIATLG